MSSRQLTRYVGAQVLLAILLVLAVLLGLDFLGAMVNEIDDLQRDYTFVQAIIYVLLTIPRRLSEYMPYAVLVGCLAGLGSLANNSELTVMRAAGVSTVRLVWMVVRPTLLFVMITMMVAEYVAPISEQLAKSRKAMMRIGPAAMTNDEGLWNREGNTFMHFNVVQRNGVLYGVTLFEFDDQKNLKSSLFAQRASYQQDEYWLLEDGLATELTEQQTHSVEFTTRRWDTGFTPELLSVALLEPRQLSISALWRYADYRVQQGQEAGRFLLSFWTKLLQPLSIMGLVMIAISFVFGPLREVTMGYRIFAGVLVGVVFRTVQGLLGPSSLVFGFSPFYAVMIPVCVSFIVGFYFLRRR
ncbi:MAG: LPS export ABC transporter permease LptG [Pseudomonadales bacterium]